MEPFYTEEEEVQEWLGFLDLLLGQLPVKMQHDEAQQDEAQQERMFAEQVERTYAALLARESLESPVRLPLAAIRDVIPMSETGFLALLMALAVQYDRKYEDLYARLQDHAAEKLPTIGLLYMVCAQWIHVSLDEVAALFEGDADAFSLLWEQQEEVPLSRLHRRLILRPAVLSYLHPQASVPEAIAAYAAFAETDEAMQLPEDYFFLSSQFGELMVLYRYQAEIQNTHPMFYLYGKKGIGKKTLASRVCREAGKNCIFLSLSGLQAAQEKWEITEVIRALSLIAILYQAVLCIQLPEAADGKHMDEDRLQIELLYRYQSCIFVMDDTGRHGEILPAAHVVRYEVASYPMAVRREIWKTLLQDYPLEEDVSSDEFAWQYDLTAGEVICAMDRALDMALVGRRDAISADDITRAILGEQHLDFQDLATKIKVVYNWDDIYLQERQKEIVHLACARYRQRNRLREEWGLGEKNAYGNGLSILLYGPPGTGKTMLTHIFARELRMDLYRVDLSQISSKYIGETEKNLKRIFDEANQMNVILFFDEADSLFSKRTEVSNSNDKYANAETAYILQRIEEYDGVTILATNLYNNFDAAFMRRITYFIRFESPDEELRYQLWTGILPEKVPMDPTINFRFFAERFELSGSSIKSILYNAAYMAGTEGVQLSAKHIISAIQYENQKQGKINNNEVFMSYSPKSPEA